MSTPTYKTEEWRRLRVTFCDCGQKATRMHAGGPSCESCYEKYQTYFKSEGQHLIRHGTLRSPKYREENRDEFFAGTKHLVSKRYNEWQESHGQRVEGI